MKVKIWVPTHDQRVPAHFALQQLPLDIQAFAKAGMNMGFSFASSCDLNGMRNSALEEALAEDYDFLIMQDADVVVEGGGLLRLVQSCEEHDATACVAAVATRQIERNRLRMNVLPFKPDEVYEVERAGTGCIAMDLRRLRKMAEEYDGPWFWREYEDKRCTTQKVGQDIFFTYLVASLGGKTVCDSRIETNHPHLNHDHLAYIPTIVKSVVES